MHELENMGESCEVCAYEGFTCRGVCVSVSLSAARPVTVREKEEGKECHLTEPSHS